MDLKGVVLAGGNGTRLLPLTKVTNKHLLPVGGYPMIYWPLVRLIEAGVHEIMIVTGTEHMGDMISLLGSGSRFDADFSYKVQDKPGGIAQALGLAQNFVGRGSCIVILGDNIYTKSIRPAVDGFRSRQGYGATLLVTEDEEPERFGVAEFSEDDGRIISIEEKPDCPKSNLVVTGCYMYDFKVFGVVDTLKPSNRGELEITDVNNFYVRHGQCFVEGISGSWSDAGTHQSYYFANKLIFDGAVEMPFDLLKVDID